MVLIADPDLGLPPMSQQRKSIAIATAVMLVPILVIASARLAPVALAIVTLALVASAIMRGTTAWTPPRATPFLLSSLAFVGYAATSAIWAPIAWPSVEAAGRFLLAGAIVLFAIAIIRDERRDTSAHQAEGLWLGLIAAALIYAIDCYSGQSLKIALYNALRLGPGDLSPQDYFAWKDGRLIRIIQADMTRNAFALSLLLWPALLGVGALMTGTRRMVISLALVAVVIAAVAFSSHETSMLALVSGGAALVVAQRWARGARYITMALWLTACLAVLPIVWGLHASGLQTSSLLPASARSRIVIWNYTANRAMDWPYLGLGARMTYHMTKQLSPPRPTDAPTIREVYKNPEKQRPATLSTHAHNAYLQTWFELGAGGAILLAIWGLTVLVAIGRLESAVQPYALATFSSAATLATSSYGMYQFWLVSMFSLAAILLAITRRTYVALRHAS